MEGFRYSTPVDVRFGDIDLLHHVNNAAYCSILDEGRINYFRDAAPEWFDANHIAAVLVNINLDFIAPAHLFDKLEVFTRCAKIGNKSFQLEQEIYLRSTEKLLVRSHSTLVAIDPQTQQSVPITEDWIKRLETFEGRKLKQ